MKCAQQEKMDRIRNNDANSSCRMIIIAQLNNKDHLISIFWYSIEHPEMSNEKKIEYEISKVQPTELTINFLMCDCVLCMCVRLSVCDATVFGSFVHKFDLGALIHIQSIWWSFFNSISISRSYKQPNTLAEFGIWWRLC